MILIEERSEHVLVSGDVRIRRDKDDDFIIETAVKGNARYLITRDDDVKSDKNVAPFIFSTVKRFIRSLDQVLNR